MHIKEEYDLVGFLLTCKKICAAVDQEEELKRLKEMNNISNNAIDKNLQKKKQKKLIAKDLTMSEDHAQQ